MQLRGDGAPPPAGTGADQFATAWRLAAGAWLGCALLQILLYVRPTPYGGAFLLEWRRYFSLALYYEMLGIWLLALPFLLVWLALYRLPVAPPWRRALLSLQVALLTANLFVSQFDHEVLRFLGVRLGLSFLATYVRTETISDSLFVDVMLDDPGGPLLPVLILLLVPGVYLWWAMRLVRRGARRRLGGRVGLAAAMLIAIVPLAAPGNAWRMASSQFRLRKVEPVVLALATDIALGFEDLEAPPDLPLLASDYQSRWLAASADKSWRFADPDRPYLREPVGPPPPRAPGGQWNVIYIQLETFRGVDTGFLRPGLSPSPTPYLDGLVASGEAAAWTRTLSFGMPSINGLFAGQCSIMPHSRRFITGFTYTDLHCLPEALRRRGYRAEMFNAGDTDWDNSTWWATRWYDRLHRYPKAKEHDRPVFRAAAARIRALGASGRPFLATLVSVTNHTPFRSREPAFDIAGHGSPSERILNTTRYTDDVVREFVESLRSEPWFARTIIVITGDHGINLGEHGGRPGDKNLYRESVWVPLILLGAHPRLPRGRHDEMATMLDIAPTLADLIGLREAVPWQGHSLLAVDGARRVGFVGHGLELSETGRWSAVADPATGAPGLFDSRRDWLQRHDLSRRHPGLAHALTREARDASRLNDYLLSAGKVWKRP